MTHDERVWHHEMETLEGIHEHAERIASLEELCVSLYRFAMSEYPDGTELNFAERMRELGLEVPDE